MSDLTASPIIAETTDSQPTSQEPGPLKTELTPEQQVAELLMGKKIPEKEPDAAPGREPAAEQQGKTEEGAPETEGDDPEATPFDYTQTVKLSNGQSMSVGELKDFYQGYDAKVVDLIDRENKVLTQRNELGELAQYLQLPPEVREKIAVQQKEHLQAQHGLMLEAIPEWKDRQAFEAGRVAIFDLGKEYGVDLSQVTDHRVVKMLNDFSRLKTAIKTAKAQVKQVKGSEPKAIPKGPKVNGTELTNAIARAKQTGNIADQLGAVDLLLKG